MDIGTAKRVLSALANGIDPRTGEILDPGSLINSAEVVRALHLALTALDWQNKEPARDAQRTPNAGKPWTAENDRAVVTSFDSGERIGNISDALGRTCGSIAARLVRLGNIPDRQSAFAQNKNSETDIRPL